MNNNDDKFRVDNLKRDCLYRFLVLFGVGFLVGYLMNRHRVEDDTLNYLIWSPIFFTCLGAIINFIRYKKGMKKINEKVMYDEKVLKMIEEDDNNE